MRKMTLSDAIDDAIAQAMAADPRIVLFGEDVQGMHLSLFARFGDNRVRNCPISEGAFVGAAVAAAAAGLRPIVEVMLVDFLPVAMSAVVNEAAKTAAFSGGTWSVPLVIRASCGGGYGDGGQHEQSLWGWLAHIPGLAVVVPSTPADAGNLTLAAIEDPGPVILLEHKLLSDRWLDPMGRGGRSNVQFDVPEEGRYGKVPRRWAGAELGAGVIRRDGTDIIAIGVGVDVHRALEAAELLEQESISMGVVDLRTVAPIDIETIIDQVRRTGRVIVVDEDYKSFGLSGEIAAILAEREIPHRFARVATEETIPFDRLRERRVLPSASRIAAAARRLME